MIVPEFWAEAKEQIRLNGRSATYKRFGWSDVSEEDAQSNAFERVQEAVQLAKEGHSVRKVDHKVTYNGEEGLPIREEIINRFGDHILTRNVYGALCLNTPDVAFADIDIDQAKYYKQSYLFIVLVGSAVGYLISSWWPFTIAFLGGMFLVPAVTPHYISFLERRKRGPFESALKKSNGSHQNIPTGKCAFIKLQLDTESYSCTMSSEQITKRCMNSWLPSTAIQRTSGCAEISSAFAPA